jgi:hypothetical protein
MRSIAGPVPKPQHGVWRQAAGFQRPMKRLANAFNELLASPSFDHGEIAVPAKLTITARLSSSSTLRLLTLLECNSSVSGPNPTCRRRSDNVECCHLLGNEQHLFPR